jgi:peroxiredoxin
MVNPMKRLFPWLLALSLLVLVSDAWALSVGSRAPALEGKDQAGNALSLKKLSGKVVLVDFWATWCAPCEKELPVLEKLYKRYQKDGLVIVGVSVDKDASKISRFLRRMGLSFPVVHDQDGSIADRYQPEKMPSSYLVDRKGMVTFVQKGFRESDEAELEARIKSALGL